jgi:hypothetical protein
MRSDDQKPHFCRKKGHKKRGYPEGILCYILRGE